MSAGKKKAGTRVHPRKKGRKAAVPQVVAGQSTVDKIAAALTLVPAAMFAKVSLHGNINWDPKVLVLAALLWAWSDQEALTRRWQRTREILASWFPSAFLAASYQAFIKTLTSNTAVLLAVLMIHLHAFTRTANPHACVHDRAVFAVDGTKVGVPWSDDTDRKLGQQTLSSRKKNKKRRRKRSANSQAHQAVRPQIMLTLFWHLATGLPWVWQQGAVGASERDLARPMLPQLPPRSIIVGDAGFTGYEFWHDLLAAEHDFVIRVGTNVKLLKKLGWKCRAHGDLVYLWPATQQHQQQPPLVVRLVAFRTQRSVIWVATSITSRHQLSDRQIETLYRQRWGIEGWFRSLKQTFGKRKMHSLTADHAQCELDWAIIGLALIQAHGIQALIDQGVSPHDLSEAQAIDAMRSTVLQQDFQPGDFARLRTRLATARVDDYQRTAPKAGRHVHRQKTHVSAGCPKIIHATKAQQRLAQQIQAAFGVP